MKQIHGGKKFFRMKFFQPTLRNFAELFERKKLHSVVMFGILCLSSFFAIFYFALRESFTHPQTRLIIVIACDRFCPCLRIELILFLRREFIELRELLKKPKRIDRLIEMLSKTPTYLHCSF